MKYHSKDDQYAKDAKEYGIATAGRLWALRLVSRKDRDGCQVVKVQCSECFDWYDEALEAAMVLVVNHMSYKCISCDGVSDTSSGVTWVVAGVISLWS